MYTCNDKIKNRQWAGYFYKEIRNLHTNMFLYVER